MCIRSLFEKTVKITSVFLYFKNVSVFNKDINIRINQYFILSEKYSNIFF